MSEWSHISVVFILGIMILVITALVKPILAGWIGVSGPCMNVFVSLLSFGVSFLILIAIFAIAVSIGARLAYYSKRKRKDH